jgi:hypothetical protein
MSALGTGLPTLLDLAKRTDPNGKVAAGLIEILAQTNEMLQEMPFKECNDGTTHLTTLRTEMPAVYWATINAATNFSKSTTGQIREATGFLRSWSGVDKTLADLSGDVSGFRLSEAKAFIEAMNQEAQATVIYGNQGAAPTEFNGLAIRYNALSTATSAAAANVINAAGTEDSPSDLTSIWLVSWGEETVHGLYPRGTQAGLKHEDRGLQLIQSSTTLGAMAALDMYVDKFEWHLGLALRDWRSAGRVANIDISDRLAASDSVLPGFVRRLISSVYVPGRKALYMNRTTKYLFEEECFRDVKGGGGLTYENVAGKPVAKGSLTTVYAWREAQGPMSAALVPLDIKSALQKHFGV